MNMDFKKKAEQELLMNKKLIEQVYKEAGEYANYIKLLPQKKNIGTQNTPYYIEVMVPYMTVDGRVKMAIDEHKEAGKDFVIEKAEFFLAPDGKTQLCRVTVHSAIRGTASGTIEVGTGGGVDRYNPYANAETSAIGRALGFLGYGLLGGGIASYDEVAAVMSASADSYAKQLPPPVQVQMVKTATEVESLEKGFENSEEEVEPTTKTASDTIETAKTATEKEDLYKEVQQVEHVTERVSAKEMIALKKRLKEMQKSDAEVGQILSKIKTKKDYDQVINSLL